MKPINKKKIVFLAALFFIKATLATPSPEDLLRSAAYKGDATRAKALLDAKVDPNIITREITPLAIAAQRGHIEMVKLLLAYNAHPLQKGIYKYTAFYSAVASGHTEIADLLLTAMEKCGQVENKILTEAILGTAGSQYLTMLKMLLERGVLQDSKKDGSEAIACALRTNNWEAIASLIHYGAPLNDPNHALLCRVVEPYQPENVWISHRKNLTPTEQSKFAHFLIARGAVLNPKSKQAFKDHGRTDLITPLKRLQNQRSKLIITYLDTIYHLPQDVIRYVIIPMTGEVSYFELADEGVPTALDICTIM